MKLLPWVSLGLVGIACAGPHVKDATAPKPRGSRSSLETVLASEVEWAPLNPARGADGPQAADLWGDRQSPGPTGFLVRFVDGFESPPHIHNVSYRGVVISGQVHNDDPNANPMWMPPVSFWTQPQGAVHITAAQGDGNLAYIEIENGPYLVKPLADAFSSGEEPVNVAPINLVWLNASNTSWIQQEKKPSTREGPEIAFLWGTPRDNGFYGTFLKVPPVMAVRVVARGTSFRGVVVQGCLEHPTQAWGKNRTLGPASLVSSTGHTQHELVCATPIPCVLYVRSNGPFTAIPARFTR